MEATYYLVMEGKRSAELRCIKLSDQKILWNVPSLGAGHLIRVGEESNMSYGAR